MEAAHLALALALIGTDRAPTAAMRALLGAHARRILATRAYAMRPSVRLSASQSVASTRPTTRQVR